MVAHSEFTIHKEIRVPVLAFYSRWWDNEITSTWLYFLSSSGQKKSNATTHSEPLHPGAMHPWIQLQIKVDLFTSLLDTYCVENVMKVIPGCGATMKYLLLKFHYYALCSYVLRAVIDIQQRWYSAIIIDMWHFVTSVLVAIYCCTVACYSLLPLTLGMGDFSLHHCLIGNILIFHVINCFNIMVIIIPWL